MPVITSNTFLLRFARKKLVKEKRRATRKEKQDEYFLFSLLKIDLPFFLQLLQRPLGRLVRESVQSTLYYNYY